MASWEIILQAIEQVQPQVGAFDEQTEVSKLEGWDSLKNMLFVTTLEELVGERFSFQEVLDFNTLGDVRKALDQRQA